MGIAVVVGTGTFERGSRTRRPGIVTEEIKGNCTFYAFGWGFAETTTQQRRTNV